MQPVDSFNTYKLRQGAGTTLVLPQPGVLHSIFMPQSVAGTTDFYDIDSLAGTSATNLMFTIANVQGTPINVVPDISFNKGIVAVTSGTVNYMIQTV